MRFDDPVVLPDNNDFHPQFQSQTMEISVTLFNTTFQSPFQKFPITETSAIFSAPRNREQPFFSTKQQGGLTAFTVPDKGHSFQLTDNMGISVTPFHSR